MKTKIITLLIASLSILIQPVTAADLKLEKLWQTPNDLKEPECVAFDIMRRSIYVSNINGAPSDTDGNGFISLLTTEGKIDKLKWVDGLNAPKGMALRGKQLFVTDITELLVIDVETAKVVKRFKADESSFLNDVAISSAGIVYVTDTATNRIYRLYKGSFDVWLEDERLENPNGLYIDNEHIVVGSWGVPTEGWNTEVPGHLLLISPDDKSITDFADGSPIGNLDGLAKADKNSFLVTDWMQGKLMHVSPQGEVKTLLELGQGSADILYLRSKNMLLIPHMKAGNLSAYSIKK
jgi:sugar lactone lactonase YvrE